MNEIQLRNHIREEEEIIDIEGQKGHILQEGNKKMILLEYDTPETARIGMEEIISQLEAKTEAIE